MFRIGGRNRRIPVEIRVATPADLPRIVEIGREAFDYIRNPETFFADRFEKGFFFVAEVDGNVVGFVDVEPNDPAHIAGVAVDGRFRGKGIGTELVRTALDFLRRVGCTSVTLTTTPHTVPFYKKLGFRPTGTGGEETVDLHLSLR